MRLSTSVFPVHGGGGEDLIFVRFLKMKFILSIALLLLS